MKILIEGERYPIDVLQDIFDDPKFYIQNHQYGTINSVGYYHSFERKQLVYMLPKVFMRNADNTIFGITKNELLNWQPNDSFKHDISLSWVRELLVYFYNSLKEFQRRHNNTSLLEKNATLEINSNLGSNEYSHLDLLLTFVNFYKINKNTILFIHVENQSQHAKKVKWDKTIRKNLPLLNNEKKPIYTQVYNKQKVSNNEEDLLMYYFSILHHFKVEHKLPIKINSSYKIIKGKAFELLVRNGSSKLRKIKYRYFSDTLKKMYRLCDIYFSLYDTANSKRKDEFITINNYNIVFEDMVDKLFSDSIDFKHKELSISKLKNHPDGKIIDHIYQDKSLIDNSNIFFIGDSKYYKSDNLAGKNPRFKQFTYAKNVIQFNIDILNKKNYLPNNLRYRDDITEGYNISPNFFIYGYIGELNFNESRLVSKNDEPSKSYHFKDRLFDRDTLFIHEYQINFLYVLKSYTQHNLQIIDNFRKETRRDFRNKFTNYFNSPALCGYYIYQKSFDSFFEMENYVRENFKSLNGKCISLDDTSLLIASTDEKSEYGELYHFQ